MGQQVASVTSHSTLPVRTSKPHNACRRPKRRGPRLVARVGIAALVAGLAAAASAGAASAAQASTTSPFTTTTVNVFSDVMPENDDNLAMDINGGHSAAGTPVETWDYNGNYNEQWHFMPVVALPETGDATAPADGAGGQVTVFFYEIYATIGSTNVCLSAVGGSTQLANASIVIDPCAETANQEWAVLSPQTPLTLQSNPNEYIQAGDELSEPLLTYANAGYEPVGYDTIIMNLGSLEGGASFDTAPVLDNPGSGEGAYLTLTSPDEQAWASQLWNFTDASTRDFAVGPTDTGAFTAYPGVESLPGGPIDCSGSSCIQNS
jgi:hypothetical protein